MPLDQIKEYLNNIENPNQVPPQAAPQQTGFARMQAGINEAAVCERCGGTWFRVGDFKQYSKGMYSSAPGGDLHELSVSDVTLQYTIRVCVCGFPATPNIGGLRGGRTPNQGLSSLMEALRVGQEVFKKQDAASLAVPGALEATQLAQFGSKEDVIELQQANQNMQTMLNDANTIIGSLHERLTSLENASVPAAAAAPAVPNRRPQKPAHKAVVKPKPAVAPEPPPAPTEGGNR